MSDQNPELVEIAAAIVSAYVAGNAVRTSELSGVIEAVHGAIVCAVKPVGAAEPDKPAPAVSIKRSVTPDYLISLEDGRRFKTLKRYLSGLGMTPDDYRKKWGLPSDYPMVAPAYAAQRSALAKAIGLGDSRRKNAALPDTAEPEPLAAKPRARRARSKKTDPAKPV